MKILPNRLDRGFFRYQDEFEKKAIDILRSGFYVLGNEVEKFEEEFAQYIGTNHCVGLASGLDALYLAFKILKIGAGDEVIVQGNTYIASVMGITMNGAMPVFVEPNEYFNIDVKKIEEKITERTKAILVVHLYGQASEMGSVLQLCKRYGLRLIEDCAQSHGARYTGTMTGLFGDIGCFSFYPSKNLGAFGDAGAIVTDDDELASDFKIFRNYGSEKRYYNKVIGVNSRLDELQAGLLRVRLEHIEEIIEERTMIATRYNDKLKNNEIELPKVCKESTSVWHQYVVQCKKRDLLKEYLEKKEILTGIHYPVPPHMAEAYQYLGLRRGDLPITEHYSETVLSLPIYNGMTEEEQMYVIETINHFCE